MVVQRGDVWWADLGQARGSELRFQRPVIVIQSDAFNRSRIATTLVAAVTSNLRLVDMPGNVLLKARDSGLPRDSVINISQLATVSADQLSGHVRRLDVAIMKDVTRGLRLILER